MHLYLRDAKDRLLVFPLDSATWIPIFVDSYSGISLWYAYIITLVSTTKTQNAKRTFWNARSERRGVFVVLWIPEASQSFFLLLAKRIRCVTLIFSTMFQSLLRPLLLALRKKCERSESFPFREKKDPGRKANLPHKPGEARTFFASPEKGSGVGKINFLVASYTILSP